MLRIDQRTDGDGVVLALEGDVVGAWAGELARLLDALGEGIGGIALDLANVAYVDREGERVLRGAMARGVRLRARSGFVAALLDEADPEGAP